jgi:hypothetical protein
MPAPRPRGVTKRGGWAVHALVLCGCHQAISLGDDLRSSGPTDTSAASTMDAMTSSVADASTSEASVSDTSGASSGSTGADVASSTDSTAQTTSGSTEATSDTTGGFCSIDPRDSECLNCAKTLCCPEAQSCNADPGCDCLLDCVSEEMPSTCAQTCEPNASAANLASCIGMACPMACN